MPDAKTSFSNLPEDNQSLKAMLCALLRERDREKQRAGLALPRAVSRGVAVSRRRFFQAKKCGAHSLGSPQNAATLCPLRTCAETSFRRFAHTFLLRSCRVIPQHCYTRTRP